MSADINLTYLYNDGEFLAFHEQRKPFEQLVADEKAVGENAKMVD